MKVQLFLENARFLREKFGIVPLLYGSLGLEYRTGKDLGADDIDILIPGVFLRERWRALQTALEEGGYVLTDAHEHTFEKNNVSYSYAELEDLTPFAGIDLAEIPTLEEQGVRFSVLTLSQYLQVYTASSKDGYRIHVRQKKDGEKIAFLQQILCGSKGTVLK